MCKKILAILMCMTMAFGLMACSADVEAIEAFAEKTTKKFPMDNAVVVEKTEQLSGLYHVVFENEQYRVTLEMDAENSEKINTGDTYDCVIKWSLGNCLTDYTFCFEIAELNMKCLAFHVIEKEC